MDAKKLNDLLDKIDDALGHYAGTGGTAPPYIKTDDKAIEEAIKEIRKEVKPAKKDVFVTNEDIKEPVPPSLTDEWEYSVDGKG